MTSSALRALRTANGRFEVQLRKHSACQNAMSSPPEEACFFILKRGQTSAITHGVAPGRKFSGLSRGEHFTCFTDMLAICLKHVTF